MSAEPITENKPASMPAISSQRASAPDGLFDSYYNFAITPDEIKTHIDGLNNSNPEAARLRNQLYDYRFYAKKEGGKPVVCDRFMSFWMNLLFYSKTVDTSKWRMKGARKDLTGALEDKKLRELFDDDRTFRRAIYEQLYGSARRYLGACQTDRTYTSYIFGFMALKRPQLVEKIVAEFFDAICFGWRCGLLAEYPIVGQAAFNAWIDELPGEDVNAAWRRIEKNAGAAAASEIRGILF
jgi:hypothetical protein